jgi:crotonobetainyl-CoA:carnitine CoA-transferase CaiB-like acyl-CoA transferase
VLDVGSGTWLALGVMVALYRRERCGEGGALATSLFETGANWVAYHVAANQISGTPSDRYGSGHPAFAPYGIFATADGQICLGIGGDDLFRRLCLALEIPELVAEPPYAHNVDRVANSDALRRHLESIFMTMTTDDVVKRLDEHGVACDRVQKPEDLIQDPQAEAMQILVNVDVPSYGRLTFPGLPLTFDRMRPQGRHPVH